jgi:hypothetical protein
MYHSVKQIEVIFTKIAPTYWVLREKDKNGTPKYNSSHGTFADCLATLPHGIYNISMRSNANATKDAPNYTFQYGDAVQGIGNANAKTDAAMGMPLGANWGNNSMLGMMMMMMQQNQKQHQDLMLQMHQQQIVATETNAKKDMQFFKLQMDVKNGRSTGDKIMGVLTHPNLPLIIEKAGAALNGQPTAAVGRLSTTQTVPAPRTTNEAPKTAENVENTEGSPQSAFDPDTLTEEQRTMYGKGLKINELLKRIEARFPESDPLEALENGVNMIVTMEDADIDEIAMRSLLNAAI